ncbi:hypothetical protein BDN72DRAFT_863689 [Pluteus cervinus]|uniref:Uncharacterized protein n=1 Tax=Pluteus cervinus TaxID=181527 RepID=A0ACD3A6J6_9AGAR|nr:hypothetical protein BDN72DRAFT_863689 [Pluteus cervinus]
MILDCSSQSFLHQITWTGDEQDLRLVDMVTKKTQYFSAVGVVRWIDLNCNRGGLGRSESSDEDFQQGGDQERSPWYTLSLMVPEGGSVREEYHTVVAHLKELEKTKVGRRKTKGVVRIDGLGGFVLRFEKPVFHLTAIKDEFFGEDIIRVWNKRGFRVPDDQIDEELENALVKVTFTMTKTVGICRDFVVAEPCRVDIL